MGASGLVVVELVLPGLRELDSESVAEPRQLLRLALVNMLGRDQRDREQALLLSTVEIDGALVLLGANLRSSKSKPSTPARFRNSCETRQLISKGCC